MCFSSLPKSYILADSYRPEERSCAVKIAVTAFAAVLLMILAAVFFFPFSDFISFDMPRSKSFLRLILLVPAILLIAVLGEVIRAVIIRSMTKSKVKLRFSGLYATVYSDHYFTKKAMNFIMLFPVVFKFILLFILNVIFQKDLFWFFYILQAVNIAGFSEDLYLLQKLRPMPKSVLIKRSGTEAELYLEAVYIKNYEQ